MTTFKDNKGREWKIEINASKLREIKRQLGFDLLPKGSFATLAKNASTLARDAELFIDVLWSLCRGQREVTPQDFGESLIGDPTEAATAAFISDYKKWFRAYRRKVSV
jgi:hypothetical protein